MKPLILALLAAFTIAGCTPTPKTNSESQSKPAKPAADLVTGRIALGRMNMPAHMWAGDIQPVHLESQPSKDSDGTGGKSAVWRSEWASATKSSAKDFTWSGTDAEDAPSRGLSPGGESSWSPSNTSMAAFNMGFLKVDSDQAYTTAKAKLPPKAKATPVKYALTFDGRKSQLIWRVTFGETNSVTIDIDASTGAYIRTEH